MNLDIKVSQVAAVDTRYFLQPMKDCPRGVKVQLRGKGGVFVYGTYNGKDPFWIGWAPLPITPPELKELL